MSPAADIAALAGMVRDSAGAGERRAAVWARGRLLAAGLEDVALEPYWWSRTYAWTHLLHLLAGLSRRRAVRAAALVSYALEAGGRLQWLGHLLPGTEVLVVLPGAEESGMGGMRAFLAAHALEPGRTFVLGLDTVGSGTPVLAAAEGAVLAHRYRDADLDLVARGAAAAGLPAPERWRIAGWTDPILARFAGLPAASMLSVGPGGMYTRYHRMDDLPHYVDLRCVEACARIAESPARVYAAAQR